jgi:hypothetical protein
MVLIQENQKLRTEYDKIQKMLITSEERLLDRERQSFMS